MINKNTCTHPKRYVSAYTDPKTNVYTERCLKCTKILNTRKFFKNN